MEVRVRGWSGAGEIGLCALAYLGYSAVRALSQGRASLALHNALSVIHLERRLGVGWERGIQIAVSGSHAFLDAADDVYAYGHFPVLVVTAVLLYRYRPEQYRTLRNGLALTGAVGLAIFALFPVAPPRLTSFAPVDAMTEEAVRHPQLIPVALVNQYAAMPSLHAGWSLLVAVAVFRATSNRLLKAAITLMPMAMAVAVIATANHYVLDVVAGLALAVVAVLVLDTHRARGTPAEGANRPWRAWRPDTRGVAGAATIGER